MSLTINLSNYQTDVDICETYINLHLQMYFQYDQSLPCELKYIPTGIGWI